MFHRTSSDRSRCRSAQHSKSMPVVGVQIRQSGADVSRVCPAVFAVCDRLVSSPDCHIASAPPACSGFWNDRKTPTGTRWKRGYEPQLHAANCRWRLRKCRCHFHHPRIKIAAAARSGDGTSMKYPVFRNEPGRMLCHRAAGAKPLVNASRRRTRLDTGSGMRTLRSNLAYGWPLSRQRIIIRSSSLSARCVPIGSARNLQRQPRCAAQWPLTRDVEVVDQGRTDQEPRRYEKIVPDRACNP